MSIDTQFWFSVIKKNYGFWIWNSTSKRVWILNPFVKKISDLKSIFPEDFGFWFEILSMPDFAQPWWKPTKNGIFEVENLENIDNFEENESKLFVKLYFK